jgi:F-type H+-transporting ATPase subunit c
MDKTGRWIWMLLVVASLAAPGWAQTNGAQTNGAQTDDAQVKALQSLDDPDIKEGLTVGSAIALIGVCFGAGLCVLGGGYGIARIGGACIESISRQPEAAGSMFAPMIISAAMVEGATLFAIVVCLMGILKV